MRQPDAYLNKIYDQLQQTREESNEPWELKRIRLLSKLKESLGHFEIPEGEAAKLDPIVLERVELEDVIRERVEFTTIGGLRMPAYVMYAKSIKEGEKRPAVLLWHGHGYGSRSLVGLNKDGSPKPPSGKASDHIALELARRGLVVLAPEIVGFGDRMLHRDEQQEPDLSNSCYNLSVSLMMSGKTTAGLRTYEALRAADYLSSRVDVDSDRLGNMGFSGGGIVASLSAALDMRIQASVIGIYANTYRGSILAMRHCLCNYIPGIMSFSEMPELIALLAPRALFIEAGMHDPIFPITTSKEAVDRLQQIYESLGASNRFEFDLFEGKHEVSGRQSFNWLAQKLLEEE
ncbi:dienelactone hydrolase family protein [Paenibacillus agricola]|uniref:Dienelactone hydrolase n=1 Tax=Paenibacillus agricola TaxID=2716264 RepID=A0ABX0J5E0_9BACL|nr:alpha/beta hydrolase family protein [Paenibacillus agricola]NHN31514.1 dienelactone hydrolase [Paenibacillus agricola]